MDSSQTSVLPGRNLSNAPTDVISADAFSADVVSADVVSADLGPAEIARRPGRGFTLVELLVVIVIIGILASLVSVAVVRALDTAKQTRMKVEVDQLDAAMKSYYEKNNSYPPCDLSINSSTVTFNNVRAHLARCFPRYNLTRSEGGKTKMENDLLAAGLDLSNFRPDQALVFWLQGFGPDPTNPILTADGHEIDNAKPKTDSSGNILPPVQRQSFFTFDKTRLIASADSPIPVVPSYAVNGLSVSTTTSTASPSSGFTRTPYAIWSGGGAPYLYWEAGNPQVTTSGTNTKTISNYGTVNADSSTNLSTISAIGTFLCPYSNAGTANPYWLDTTQPGTADAGENWANYESFQILAPGTDGKFGGDASNLRYYPTGKGYSADENDNVTNFCVKARLEDAKP